MAIRVRSTVAFCLAVCVCGCSVGDYENKMVEAQNRLERFEEGNRLLETGTLVMPGRSEKGVMVTAIYFFLRPPKGIGTAVTNEKSLRARVMHTFAPARVGGANPFAFVEVAYAPLAEKEFEKEVLAAFTAGGQATRRSRQVVSLGRPALNFSTVEFDDSNYSYSVNFFKGTTNQVAVVYWINRASKAQANRVIEVSLATFGVDLDTGSARNGQATPLVVPQHPSPK